MNNNVPDGGSTSCFSIAPDLVDHARSLIARGALSTRPFSHVDAGYGRNEPCHLCGRPIEPTHVRYRAPDPDGSAVAAMALHVQCYLAWESAARGR